MAVIDYTKPTTYRTADDKRTAQLDYQRGTLTVYEGPALLATITVDAHTVTSAEVWQMIAAAEAAPEHTCDLAAERKAHTQYISDGLADTDGHYAPVDFERWQRDFHRSIGYTEPRTATCTATECHAPRAEKVHQLTHYAPQIPGKPLSRLARRRFEFICTPCQGARPTA
jgi:hypothetical protein